MEELFEGSHYHLIRTNPMYRMMCQMEDMRLEMEPAWAQPQEPEPIEKKVIHIHTHLNLDKKAMELQNRIVALEQAHSDKKTLKYYKYK